MTKQPYKVVKKGWGEEVWIWNGNGYCGKFLYIDEGKQCSLHYHPIKTECFYVDYGAVLITYGPVDELNSLILEMGESFSIPSGTPHRFKALHRCAKLIEFSTEHSDDDVVRLLPGD